MIKKKKSKECIYLFFFKIDWFNWEEREQERRSTRAGGEEQREKEK